MLQYFLRQLIYLTVYCCSLLSDCTYIRCDMRTFLHFLYVKFWKEQLYQLHWDRDTYTHTLPIIKHVHRNRNITTTTIITEKNCTNPYVSRTAHRSSCHLPLALSISIKSRCVRTESWRYCILCFNKYVIYYNTRRISREINSGSYVILS